MSEPDDIDYGITVRDPWVQAIIWGPCRILNREERPPEKVVGERVAVRTAKSLDENAWDYCFAGDSPWSQYADDVGQPYTKRSGVIENRHHPGHIIGTVRVVGDYSGPKPFIDDHMLPASLDSRWHDACYGHTAEEFAQSVEENPWYSDLTKWSWLLADPEPLDEPVPARGQPGVWDVDEQIEEEL